MRGPLTEQSNRMRRTGILIGVFICLSLLGAGGLFVIRFFKVSRPEPGRLVADQVEKTWRGPESTAPKPVGGSEAQVHFELKNLGGRPVHVTSIETSCGCTSAKVHPDTIEPGGSGAVDVHADPFPVGVRNVAVTLRTDSEATPSVDLRLRLIGSRRPPFLLQAVGDLQYVGSRFEGEKRQIAVILIEPSGSTSKPPILKSDLPFLVFSQAKVQAEPYVDPGTVQRTYIYDVNLAATTPEHDFSGEVIVIDPWEDGQTQRIQVRGELIPAVQVFPKRIVLRVRPTGEGPESMKLLVRTVNAAPALDVAVEQGKETPLVIHRLETQQDERGVVFSVGLKRQVAKAGNYTIVVREKAKSSNPISVPVSVRMEETR